MKKHYLLIILIFLFFNVSCHNHAVKTENTHSINKTDTIPFTMVDTVPQGIHVASYAPYNRLYCHATVGGKSFRALIDNGYTHSALTEDFLCQLGENVQCIEQGNKSKTYLTDLTLSLHSSDVKLDTIYTIDIDWDADCQGIIGIELFESNIVELDFINRQMIIHSEIPNKISSYKALDLFTSSKDTVFGALRRTKIDGFVNIKGEKTSAVLTVDLGCPYLAWEENFRETITTDSSKQDYNSMAYLLLKTSHQLNDYSMPISKVDIEDQDGLMGVDFLSHFNVIFDYPHNKLYLKPNKK